MPLAPCLLQRSPVKRIGRLTRIQRGAELTASWEFDPRVPPIQPQVLEQLYGALDIGTRGEICRDPHPSSASAPAAPNVFISYSWGSPEHEQWVALLAGHLRGLGIDAKLDKWIIHPGRYTCLERATKPSDSWAYRAGVRFEVYRYQ
jgi:hypothetical protein